MPSMDDDSTHTAKVLAGVRRGEYRSPLFWWLVDHHDEMIAAADGDRIDWHVVAVRLREAGKTDASGKPATPRRARATWYKVRRYVAAKRERAALRGGRIMPSRLSPATRPATTPVPAEPLPPDRGRPWAVASEIRPPESIGRNGPPPTPERVSGAEEVARIRRKLANREY